jgi:type IV pilus assembly protein PilA
MSIKPIDRASLQQGFTLIELLVVILIIGILAAIAIPSFLNQRVKGQDACAKSMARTMQTAMETYYTDNDSYAATGANLSSLESQITTTAPCGGTSSASVGTAADCAAGTGGTDNYCVRTTSVSGNVFNVVRSNTGVISRTCTTAGSGGCKTGGIW